MPRRSETHDAEMIGWKRYAEIVQAPVDSSLWIAVTNEELPVANAYEWSILPGCGAVVLFSGTMRNHSDGRDEVQKLTYEAYEEQAVVRMRAIAEEAQRSWTGIGRIAMIHRLGDLLLGDSAVIVCVSSGHRPEAFAAARFCIDALKASVPIWKKEEWVGGSDWGTRSQDIGKVTAPQTESAQ